MLARPTSTSVPGTFAESWALARARWQLFFRQYQQIRDRLYRECGIGFDVECRLPAVWTWEWLINLFRGCGARSLDDMRALLEAARGVDQELRGVDGLPNSVTFVEYKDFGRLPGCGLCEITQREHARASACDELGRDPGRYLWLDRLLDPRPLSEDEHRRISRTGYVIHGRDVDNGSWVGKGFRNYQHHVARAIRDGIRALAINHRMAVPADLDGMEYGTLLDEATTWLASAPPPAAPAGQQANAPAEAPPKGDAASPEAKRERRRGKAGGRPPRSPKEKQADLKLYTDYMTASMTKEQFIRERFAATQFDDGMTRLETGRKDYERQQAAETGRGTASQDRPG